MLLIHVIIKSVDTIIHRLWLSYGLLLVRLFNSNFIDLKANQVHYDLKKVYVGYEFESFLEITCL